MMIVCVTLVGLSIALMNLCSLCLCLLTTVTIIMLVWILWVSDDSSADPFIFDFVNSLTCRLCISGSSALKIVSLALSCVFSCPCDVVGGGVV